MDKDLRRKLLKRHERLKGMGKIRLVIDESGVSTQTYSRAIKGEINILQKTLIRILTAQKIVLEKAEKDILSA